MPCDHKKKCDKGECCDDKPGLKPETPRLPFAVEPPRPMTLEEAANWWTRLIRRLK